MKKILQRYTQLLKQTLKLMHKQYMSFFNSCFVPTEKNAFPINVCLTALPDLKHSAYRGGILHLLFTLTMLIVIHKYVSVV